MERSLSPQLQALLAVTDGDATAGGGSGGAHFSEEEYIWPRWLTVFSSVTICLGFVTNAWVLYQGFRQGALRKSPFHLLLLNHCIACFLLCGFVYPVLIYRSNQGLSENSAENQLCRVCYVCLFWWLSVALLNNAAMACNRASSCLPFLHASRILRSMKGTYVIILLIWILAFLMYMIPAAYLSTGWAATFLCYELRNLFKNLLSKEVDQLREVIQYECSLTVLMVLLLSLLCYGVIINHLFGCLKIVSTSASDSVRRRKERKRALGVIALGLCVFLLCWVPDMWVILWKAELLKEIPILHCLPMLETALNPILYMVCLPVFRPRRPGPSAVAPHPSPKPARQAGGLSLQARTATSTRTPD